MAFTGKTLRSSMELLLVQSSGSEFLACILSGTDFLQVKVGWSGPLRWVTTLLLPQQWQQSSHSSTSYR